VTIARLRIALLLLGGFLMGSPCNGGGDDDGGSGGGDIDDGGGGGGGGGDGSDGGGGGGGGVDTDGDGTADADDACPIDPTAAAGTCQLTEACAITGDAEGTPLSGDPALAYAGRFIALEPTAACGQDFDFEWFHGTGTAGALSSRDRRDFFLLSAREAVELRVLHEGRRLITRSLAVEAIEVPVAGEMLVTPIKPTVFEQATVTVTAIVDGERVPVTAAPGVGTVDYELLQLDEAFLPAGVIVSQTGMTAASLSIPPQAAGWYMARAIARDAQGEIAATPLPASFEFVAQ
jgi:hypothetical protein